MRLGTTPSQTIGPFFGVLRPLTGPELAPRGHSDAIVIEGRVLDGAGDPVADAMLELWQADAEGVYAHPDDLRSASVKGGFTGFGRGYTDAQGRFTFVTVKPGRVPGFDERMQAPHISISIFARGLLNRLVTRLYFPDEEAANARDPVLSDIGDDVARRTLIAEATGPRRLRFDIRLQGEGETAFFAV